MPHDSLGTLRDYLLLFNQKVREPIIKFYEVHHIGNQTFIIYIRTQPKCYIHLI